MPPQLHCKLRKFRLRMNLLLCAADIDVPLVGQYTHTSRTSTGFLSTKDLHTYCYRRPDLPFVSPRLSDSHTLYPRLCRPVCLQNPHNGRISELLQALTKPPFVRITRKIACFCQPCKLYIPFFSDTPHTSYCIPLPTATPLAWQTLLYQ